MLSKMMRMLPGKTSLVVTILASSVGFGSADELVWEPVGEMESFRFEAGFLKGRFVADDKRPLGKGYGRHGFRELTFRGLDLHAPTGKIGAKRRHQGILNLYRVYSATESFGSLRDDHAEVATHKNGATLRWAATEIRPVEISATWLITGPAQVDLKIVATPKRDITNFEILPATYVPVTMKGGIYLAGNDAPRKTIPVSNPDSTEEPTYPFYPLGNTEVDSQKNTGRIHSTWTWPTKVMNQFAALPIVFAENQQVRMLQFASPDSTSAVCVTPKPESNDPENWTKVEQHSALYFSLFGRDVKAGETCTSHIRLLVLDNQPDTDATVLDKYRDFLQSLNSDD